MDSDIGATATLMQQQHQTLDGNHQQGQKEQHNVNGTVESAEGHAVDRFRGEAGCLAKEMAVVASDNDSVGDSSTQCSDGIDDDNEEEKTDVEESGAGGWIMNPPVSTIVQQHQAFDTKNGYIALPNPDSNFSNVRVTDSSNVHLVNEVNYHAPVTIHVNHVVNTNSSPTQDASKLDANISDNTSNLSTNKDNGALNGCIFPQNTKLNKVTQWFWTSKLAVLSYLTIILLAIVVPITVHFTHYPDVSPAPPEPTTLVPSEIPDSSTEDNNGTDTSFRIVERDEWDAEPPLEPPTKMNLPVSYVIISHTVTSFCTTLPECAFQVRFVQYTHFKDKHFSDIGYNFLVGGDGFAYVGRNWDYVGAHARGYNSRSIGISFIGNFSSVVPPKLQLRAAQKIIELGVKAGKIAPDYKLLGHRQVSNTQSPGDALYNEIKKWPHWSPKP